MNNNIKNKKPKLKFNIHFFNINEKTKNISIITYNFLLLNIHHKNLNYFN